VVGKRGVGEGGGEGGTNPLEGKSLQSFTVLHTLSPPLKQVLHLCRQLLPKLERFLTSDMFEISQKFLVQLITEREYRKRMKKAE